MRHTHYIATLLLPLMGATMCAKESSLPSESSPYITRVIEYRPAPGQFVNKMPLAEEGDTQESMNERVLELLGEGAQGVVTLGGYGGYVTVGFDHTIENKDGVCDFRVLGNAYYSTKSSGAEGGSCEAGIIMVAQDINGNGLPDDDEWYEIEGSSHQDQTQEAWYEISTESGNDTNTYLFDFEITYTRPLAEPSADDYSTYIPWSDNRGGEGYVAKSAYHTQSYFPLWIEEDLTFRGSRLPQNGVLEESIYVLYKFGWGYADNDTNDSDGSAIDISWAVDSDGCRVELSGVDFVRIYNGVNQRNDTLGESSTEVLGVEDLHLLGVVIESKY